MSDNKLSKNGLQYFKYEKIIEIVTLKKKRDKLSIQEISLSIDFFQATHSTVKDMFCKLIIFNNYFKFFY